MKTESKQKGDDGSDQDTDESGEEEKKEISVKTKTRKLGQKVKR